MSRRACSVTMIDRRKTHKSIAQIEQRAQWEQRLKSELGMKEAPAVKADPAAHKAFKRLRAAFSAAGMDEALFEAGINRYCIMLSELARNRAERQRIRELSGGDPLQIEKLLQQKDSTIAKLRDQLLQLEKENLLTVNSRIGRVPDRRQQEEEQREESSGIAAFIQRRRE